MELLILPVSGGGFVGQLAALQHLSEINYRPTITLASSGGNVAAYIASAADWRWSGIERIARELGRNVLVKPWSSIPSMAIVIGFFQGNVCSKGDGAKEFFERYFTSTTVTKYEIWTGTYNKNQQKNRLFCNRSRENAHISVTENDLEITRSENPYFCNGNLDMLSRASVASASIPAFVDGQMIDKEVYIDGGVYSASPLTIMKMPILRTVSNDQVLHITYVNSDDLSRSNDRCSRNVMETWKHAATDLIRSQRIVDRLTAHDMITSRHDPEDIQYREMDANYENMKLVEEIKRRSKTTLVEFYPKGLFEINLMDFTGEDTIRLMKEAYKGYSCRIWWSEL